MEVVQFGERELGELADIIRYCRKNGLWSTQGDSSDSVFGSASILVKNTEANVIPAYGCMEVTGTVDESGQAYVTVKKPTSTGVHFLFNGHYEIEASGYGCAQSGDVIRAYKSTGTVTFGNRWRPTASQYYLTKGVGHYVVLGSDDIGTDVIRFRFDPSIRLYRFTLNASLAGGTADADIIEMDGTDTTIDDTVRDPEGIFAALTTVGDSGLCKMQDNKFYVIQAGC